MMAKALVLRCGVSPDARRVPAPLLRALERVSAGDGPDVAPWAPGWVGGGVGDDPLAPFATGDVADAG